MAMASFRVDEEDEALLHIEAKVKASGAASLSAAERRLYVQKLSRDVAEAGRRAAAQGRTFG